MRKKAVTQWLSSRRPVLACLHLASSKLASGGSERLGLPVGPAPAGQWSPAPGADELWVSIPQLGGNVSLLSVVHPDGKHCLRAT